MAPIQRLRALWQNFPGAPGYTNFYVGTNFAGPAPFTTFFDAIKVYLPLSATIQVPNSGDIVVQETGQIGGVWTSGTVGNVTGSGAGAYSGASGAVVEWLTNGIVAGRRVTGKTFLVPLSGAFDSTGSLSTGALTALQNAAAALIAALTPNLLVYARPFPGKPAEGTKPAKPARSGTSYQVVAARIPDLAAVMRSRRT